MTTNNTTTTARTLYARMDAAVNAADLAADRYDRDSMNQSAAARLAYMTTAARAALVAAEQETPAPATKTARPADPAEVCAARRDQIAAETRAHTAAQSARSDAVAETAERIAEERSARRTAADLARAEAITAAPEKTPARAAWDALAEDPEALADLLAVAYWHCRREAERYKITPAAFDAAETPEDLAGAQWLTIARTLDRLDEMPAEDERRGWGIHRVAVRATCAALHDLDRAEIRNASALVWVDALDGEAKTALIDTAARANGSAPRDPESEFIARETVAEALAAVCRSEEDARAVALIADGYSMTDAAAVMGVKRQTFKERLDRIRARAAALPWARDAQREQDTRTAAQTLADFGDRFAAAERISRATAPAIG